MSKGWVCVARGWECDGRGLVCVFGMLWSCVLVCFLEMVWSILCRLVWVIEIGVSHIIKLGLVFVLVCLNELFFGSLSYGQAIGIPGFCCY